MKIALVIFFGLNALSASAVEQAVSLSVPGMDCPVCPITVKKSLQKVDGVKQVTVDFAAREVAVTFEDVTATIE